MPKLGLYKQPKTKYLVSINQWDIIILVLFFGVLAGIVWGAQQMAQPYELGDPIPISLEITKLPGYALSTVLRMAIALFFSFVFTFTIGTLAAKSKKAERFILPFIDIMQSVPILGFLSISIFAFIYLFPDSLLGPECAAIFVIFTSQVWNMALSFYQSLRTIPRELSEAAAMFHLRPWQKFWRLEVPFAMPSLLWNTMMSLSAGWFFVVASEAISVANQNITLPGIGSYISVAVEQSDYLAILYVIITMLLVILIYDQLIFRPLISWSEKFKSEPNLEVESTSTWFLNIIQRATISKIILKYINNFRSYIINPRIQIAPNYHISPKVKTAISFTAVAFWNAILFISILATSIIFIRFVYKEISLTEVGEVFYLGFITGIKVTILILMCSIIWVPIGVWIGLHPKSALIIQPIAQFLAAFPANLLYPVLFMLIMTYNLNVEIWCTPLMILGTQWYILFNVIAGASNIPMELRFAIKNYNVKGLLKWKKLILPGIFPFYVTGAMAAAGGCWNASIVAEVIKVSNTTIYATGLGGYIEKFTTSGDFPRIALGIAVMCLYVVVLNRIVWCKLYDLAEERYTVS